MIETGFDINGFGNFIKIKDGNKIWLYSHLSTISVDRHQTVTKGQIIGVMGNTGHSTGAHLHLGLKIIDTNGNVLNNDNGYFGAVDPLPYLLENKTPEKPNQIANPKPDWVKFEKICGLDHTIYFQNIINDNNWPLAINDYADRVAEKNFEISLRKDAEEMVKMLMAKLDTVETENDNLKKDWAVLDKQGSDARAENQNLKSEIENLKNQTQIEIIKNSDATNQSQKVFDVVNDITAQINTKIEPNTKDNQNTANKPFWQSKKLTVTIISLLVGGITAYFDIPNVDFYLNVLSWVSVTYLSGQSLVDTGLVNEIIKAIKTKSPN